MTDAGNRCWWSLLQQALLCAGLQTIHLKLHFQQS